MFYDAFKPVVVVRLTESGCLLNVAILNDLKDSDLIISRVQGNLDRCSAVLDELTSAVKKLKVEKKNEKPVVYDGGAVVVRSDGESLFFEITGEFAALYGEIRNPPPSQKERRGVVAVCAQLLDAARSTTPKLAPSR